MKVLEILRDELWMKRTFERVHNGHSSSHSDSQPMRIPEAALGQYTSNLLQHMNRLVTRKVTVRKRRKEIGIVTNNEEGSNGEDADGNL